jgi:signal transduction histidine kinase
MFLWQVLASLHLNKEKVDLSELTGSLVERFEEEIKLYNADVKTVIKEQQLIASLDPIRIEQAVSNLLINALKYSGGGKIVVSVEKENNLALIKVKDEGQGIKTEHLDQIFEPFKRVANDTDKGLGVGLFITKQIVERHGGKILC